MKTYLYIAILALSFLMNSGCGLAYSVLLGVDTTPEWTSDIEVLKQAKKYRIPEGSLLVMDTAAYYRDLKQIYREVLNGPDIKNDSSALILHKKALKDDTQPAQFRLFDREGNEIFKMVNCYIDPPMSMNWNVGGCFDTFPPKTQIESLNIHHFGLDLLLENARLPDGKKWTLDQLPEAEYYAVVMWNSFFKRPSKRLIETAKKYVSDSGASIALIYVNNHNAFLWAAMDEEDRQRVKADGLNN